MGAYLVNIESVQQHILWTVSAFAQRHWKLNVVIIFIMHNCAQRLLVTVFQAHRHAEKIKALC